VIKNNNRFELTEILENATISYTDNVKEQFEAIRLADKGIIIGRIIDGKFFDCGFISKQNIKEIKKGIKRKIPKMKK